MALKSKKYDGTRQNVSCLCSLALAAVLILVTVVPMTILDSSESSTTNSGASVAAAVFGSSVTTREVTAKVYTTGFKDGHHLTAAFPPHQQLINGTAICFSGGGVRAASIATGVLRALHVDHSLMKHIDGVTSNSGGTWASSVYMFQQKMSYEKVLGSNNGVTNAELSKLTKDELGKNVPPLLKSLGSSGILDSAELFRKVSSMSYIDFIANTVLEPFGLDDTETYMALDSEQASNISKRADIPESKFQLLQQPSGRHQAYIMAGTIFGPEGFVPNSSNARNFQMGADFTGVPTFRSKDGAKLQWTAKDKDHVTKSLHVGGGLLESFAMGSAQSPGDDTSGPLQSVQLSDQDYFSLAKAVTISSDAKAGEMAMKDIGRFAVVAKNTDAKTSISFKYWPISPAGESTQNAEDFAFGDGGSTDNTAVLQALQRGATKLVVVDAADSELHEIYPFCEPGVKLNHTKENSLFDRDIGTLFGFGSGFKPWHFDGNNQVFPKEDLAPTLCKLQTLLKAGKPAVAQLQLKTVANEVWGIEAGRAVGVIWMLNSNHVTDFETTLPPETQTAINDGKGHRNSILGNPFKFKPFPDWPLVPSPFGVDVESLNLLSIQAQYGVDQNKGLFREFLIGSSGT